VTEKPLIHIHPNVEKCADGKDHDFEGWEDFEDGSGGEQVCKKCGLGAMEYTLRTGS